MRDAPTLQSLPWRIEPMRLAAAWPTDRALMMLHSGRTHERWARWSVLAEPVAIYRFDGRSTLGQMRAASLDVRFGHDPMGDLDRLLEATRLSDLAAHVMALPFTGGWIGYVSYDLGRRLEPAAGHEDAAPPDRPWPLIELAWCPDALVYDHVSRTWHEVGRVEGRDEIAAASAMIDLTPPTFAVGALRSSFSPDAYLAAVERTVDYIGAGDLFQANITRRFSASFEGSSRALWRAAMEASRAWYGASLEFDHDGTARRVLSLSPELFLQFDAVNRRVTTRPIKGTRRIDADPEELRKSCKDEAELNMIVDLMRNDLGRVCEFGSVRVVEPRHIETHPTVHHGVGEIEGRLRKSVTIGGLLGATFPGGSITGAPKIRAMQIIEELEPVRRGPYCGAVGYFGDSGHVCLNIAIRTLMLTGAPEGGPGAMQGMLDYGAGGGIVADSQPMAEYRECLDKVEVLRQALRGAAGSPITPRIA